MYIYITIYTYVCISISLSLSLSLSLYIYIYIYMVPLPRLAATSQSLSRPISSGLRASRTAHGKKQQHKLQYFNLNNENNKKETKTPKLSNINLV